MRSRVLWAMAGMLLCLMGQGSLFAQAKVTVGEVRETRSNNSHGAIHLKLVVADKSLVQQSKAFRVVPSTARDELGVDLIDPRRPSYFYESRIFARKGFPVMLNSPPRHSSMIRELTGEIHVFVPGRDPSAIVTVDSFLQQAGDHLVSSALAVWGIELHMSTTVAQGGGVKVNGAGGTDLSGSEPAGVRSVRFTYNDPNAYVAGFEFADAQGNVIRPTGSGHSPAGVQRTWFFSFRNGLSDSARLMVFLATPASIVRVPFSLANIPLP
jgi:catechol 2,3-dioxygenase-like lactoylglutathione lyase family enzyme